MGVLLVGVVVGFVFIGFDVVFKIVGIMGMLFVEVDCVLFGWYLFEMFVGWVVMVRGVLLVVLMFVFGWYCCCGKVEIVFLLGVMLVGGVFVLLVWNGYVVVGEGLVGVVWFVVGIVYFFVVGGWIVVVLMFFVMLLCGKEMNGSGCL